MSTTCLYFETLLDIAAIVLAVLLIARAHDNTMRLWWGILSLAVGAILLGDNIKWIISLHTAYDPADACGDLLVPSRMLRFFVLATCVSLFPFISLRPDYVNRLRLLAFSLPVLAVLLVELCYHLFNGHYTHLDSWDAVAGNLGRTDVRLRLAVFAVSVLLPALYFFFPVLLRHLLPGRHSTPRMKMYIASMLVVLVFYALYTLLDNGFIINAYGIVIISFFNAFSLFFLRYENPLSRRGQSASQASATDPEPLAAILYGRMTAWLESNHPLVNPDYSLHELARELNAKPSLVGEAIKSGGFTGFREWANYMRIQHFKQAARHHRNRTVKELMHESGFTSRSSFYRLFALYEQATPSEYIEQLYREDISS